MIWVVVIARDPEIQRALPQVFRASMKKFPMYLMEFADATQPDNLEIWLGKSTWTTQESFLLWLHLLADQLQRFKDTHQFVLVADALKAHINEDITSWCFIYDILFVLLPGGLTWLLQPLDVYVFGQWKLRFRTLPQVFGIKSNRNSYFCNDEVSPKN